MAWRDLTENIKVSVNTSEVTDTTQSMSVNTEYIANNANLVTFTLPANALQGDVFRIIGKGAGGWKVEQNAGQTIYFGNQTTTTGTGGSLASTHQRDVVEIKCITENTGFQVLNSQGNITIV